MAARDHDRRQRTSTLQFAAFWLALATAVATPCALEWFTPLKERDISALYYPGLSLLVWTLLAVSVRRREPWTSLTTATLTLWAIGLVFPFCGQFLGWTRDGTADPYGLHDRLPFVLGIALILNAVIIGVPMLMLHGLAALRTSMMSRRIARDVCVMCEHQLMAGQDVCPECGARRRYAPTQEPEMRRRMLIAFGLGCLLPPLIATAILEAEEVVLAREAEVAFNAGEDEFERNSLFGGRMWWRRDRDRTPARFGGGFGSFRD